MNGRVLATVLSFVFPGLGQFYNGQPLKGLRFVGLQIPALLLAGLTDVPFYMLFLAGGPFFVWGAWDAYSVAARRDFYRAFE